MGRWMAVCRVPAISLRWVAIALLAGFVAACQGANIPKHLKPLPPALVASMERLGMQETSPIFIRIFKEESLLEVWKQKRDGQFALLKTYEICKWSGELGPKQVEGDRQAPEGFYTVTPAQMNPNSNYYLSFNIGYPNAYDRALGRTGSNLMIHGACSSAGCYSMTDESAGELFALARDSFRGGQRSFQIQALPFRMTPENLAKHHDNPNLDFWRMLKVGYDSFELAQVPPKVDVCDRRYVFNAQAGQAAFDASAPCPAYTVPESLALALSAKQASDNARYSAVVAALDQQAAGSQVTATASVPQQQPSLLTRWLSVFGGESAPSAVGSVSLPPPPAAVTVASVPPPVTRPPVPPAPALAAPAQAVAVASPVPPAAPRAGAPPPLAGAAPIVAPTLSQGPAAFNPFQGWDSSTPSTSPATH